MLQGMCQPVSLRNVQQDCGDFGGHRSKPRGWGNSAREAGVRQGPTGLEWARALLDVLAALWECWDQGYRCTYRRCLGNVGPALLVHLPECWGQGRVSLAGTPRKGDQPQTGARPTQAPAGTIPRTGRVPRYFFTFDRSFVFSCLGSHCVSEVAGVCAVHHPQVHPRAVLVFSGAVSRCLRSPLFSSFPSCPCHGCALVAHLCESMSSSYEERLLRFSYSYADCSDSGCPA